ARDEGDLVEPVRPPRAASDPDLEAGVAAYRYRIQGVLAPLAGGVSRKYTGTLLADAAKDSGIHPRDHGRRVPPTPGARDPAHQPPAPRRHARDRPQAAPAPDGDLARPPARVRPPVRAAGDLGHGALPA